MTLLSVVHLWLIFFLVHLWLMTLLSVVHLWSIFVAFYCICVRLQAFSTYVVEKFAYLVHLWLVHLWLIRSITFVVVHMWSFTTFVVGTALVARLLRSIQIRDRKFNNRDS